MVLIIPTTITLHPHVNVNMNVCSDYDTQLNDELSLSVCVLTTDATLVIDWDLIFFAFYMSNYVLLYTLYLE